MGRFATLIAVMLAGCAFASAGEMKPPRLLPATVDWEAARTDLSKLPASQDATADLGELADADPLVLANAVSGRIFSGIGNSAVPVLVPPVPQTSPIAEGSPAPANGFRATFFFAGPSGYDAAFVLPAELASSLSGRAKKEDVAIQISGFAHTYKLEPQAPLSAKPVKELEATFPGIQRLWHESNLRYAFTRYGVRYVVSMLCVDGPARGRWVACRDADRVIAQFLSSLRLAGGAPHPVTQAINTIDRPQVMSPDFTYMPPGQLLPNTGFNRYGGRADETVYAKILFPLTQAPAFANSQSFLNWGNCDFTGRTSATSRKGAPYRCKVNDKVLVFDESAAENRTYPWRDNFCEHRYFFVGQCPGGQGHQGQDIRPVTCQLRNDEADRCNPYLDDVVAVRDGTIMRTAGRESMYLVVNAPGERVRFRYLHMNPKKLDADGMTNGRRVQQGETLGKVGNFDRHENGTTYHLHFDMQLPTEFGWVFVNPYMTLVAAYERLLGGRGHELMDDVVIVAAPAGADIVDTIATSGTPREPSEPAIPHEGSPTSEETNSVDTAARIVPVPHAINAQIEP
ncbi:MAG: M23 family metallopeptidase [Xanthobacteraceae bacterium]